MHAAEATQYNHHKRPAVTAFSRLLLILSICAGRPYLRYYERYCNIEYMGVYF